MDERNILTPIVNEQKAIELVFKVYQLEVLSIKELVSYDDRNFHIKVAEKHSNPYLDVVNRDGYTLKITHKNANRRYFDSTHYVMSHLVKKGLRVPEPISGIQGTLWSTEILPVLSKDPKATEVTKECGIHLLKYLPGETISSFEYTKDILFQWGTLLASFHDAAEDISNEDLEERDHIWTMENIPKIVGYMEGLDDDNTKLVHQVLKKFTEEMTSELSSMKKGIIHGDFNDHNILAKHVGDKVIVDGILDLEDMHRGAYVWDVGLSLAYVLIRCNNMDPIEGLVKTLTGYLKHRHLSDAELRLLKICIASRLCQSLVYGAYNNRMNPENTYLLDTAPTGWMHLKNIWEIPNEILLDKWKSARPND